ncbi:aminotransferase class IV family protein [Cognatishimia activa]|uniref:Probable branched-chain-amino-acid aminotransferase n=1 Tax=Cognatishimia activa TaxID=1715691 RepID=A0A975I7W4_9RHOB|nr:aminotransferase class IV family protein [Cognatishimia activa]QTN36414.1 aminotransferase class IV [Cognatishimia activa]
MESALRDSLPRDARLIETFRWEPEAGFINLDRHLARMARSAEVLGFDYEDLWALYVIQACGDVPLRCRLTLGDEGFEFSSAPLGETLEVWSVAISDVRLPSADRLLQHKTTRRGLYDKAREERPDGIDEALMLNERGEVCEGTITNVFVTLEDGQIVTPPLPCGLLPGIQREIALENGALEAVVTVDMLKTAKAIHMGNSLRGMIPVKLV